MTIIVTGGAGFIGSNFIFYQLKHHPGDRIVCLDKLTYAGNLSTLASVMDEPNFRFVKADICDREAVNRLFEEEKPDIIVNFAAESHVDRSIEDPGVFLRTNILGTQVLMDACRKYGIGRYHQVLCVTHLAQIAAMADNHLFIVKKQENNKTYTAVHTLTKDARVREIARIIGGDDITPLKLKMAEEMLGRPHES